MLGWYLSRFLGYVLGFLYPAYASFKALESNEPEDDKQWLTYWVVISAFQVLEFVADYIICWIPLYYEVKILFVIWLQAPQTKGAAAVYHNYLQPFLKAHEKQVDEGILKAEQMAKQMAKEKAANLAQIGQDFVQKNLQNAVNAAAQAAAANLAASATSAATAPAHAAASEKHAAEKHE
eukprot:gnl/Hemi2/4578_TR1585_c0_g1_i1.p1 gnl/Hemi2/4578_TR1585_c0_g1~~gnl/Hemi2/4578_TR1585_c0_g1_i1.p1  ORF type:complete len:179 (-),score=67.29 gnl/Hemi2/4578_TR1585_c0_g1_i1:79-615(-)